MKQNKSNLNDKTWQIPLSLGEIDLLKKRSTHRSGEWEIDWGVEPFLKAGGCIGEELILVLIVHKESYFIIESKICPLSEKGKGINALISAINKDLTLPETIVVRDKVLGDELLLLATALDCKIRVSPLKAIPQIRRDMRRYMMR